ncbi:hypothetical protein [Sporosarcina sp. ANT_H38]|nr:hypothetical protein [Sporosarcina sp. ANT_H38]
MKNHNTITYISRYLGNRIEVIQSKVDPKATIQAEPVDAHNKSDIL